MKPRALVFRTAGVNCDGEMVRAFARAGSEPDLIHLHALLEDPSVIDGYDLLGFPGGFSYGDDIASGRVFAVRLRTRLYPALRAAAERGVPMIGACNGFQVLVQVGLLPGAAPWPDEPPAQTCALSDNASARFTDRWCHVKPDASSKCVWTRGLDAYGADTMLLPVAHGEGRFVTDTPETLARLQKQGQVALRYHADENPNGSTDHIAGICDPSGLILGLMPHPERYLDWTNHPYWTRLDARMMDAETPGLRMFRNAVDHVRAGSPAVTSRGGRAAAAR
ncbi:MAG: phosphoribosylformylglycinamidine synthase subunit PurQ [Phycisphaerales bacterium]